ncbi:phage-related protein [Isorropodon fossajaponicum endosymbiont JTNG4]|uniref:type II toxin-antitoxin system RelE/ParE family toxin n=1 Tax=Isorropodon fossajaponicum symbiont TaxID=883811 RepID=UPI0019156F02|nr:type II toxin-antitoxin system RelE/ParE family toxin [Isorropodon fossajaponicum symbiont]BBB23906.1 phage-related protein [Isorropodon fossajaponicum endosymbiont JTNG4]
MSYKISYFNDAVQNDILNLPASLSLLARYLKSTDMMLIHGSNLGHPHTKSLSNGLFELRLKGKNGIARVFYCTQTNQEIIMLHSYVKKSKKIPRNVLQIALTRLKEMKK